jgi:hypothetical protein
MGKRRRVTVAPQSARPATPTGPDWKAMLAQARSN